MIKRIGEREIFKTKLFIVKDIDLDSPKGNVTYQIIEKQDTALIIPVTKELDVLFVREYFYAADEYSLALPKGRIEDGSNRLETANRELQEEIGYKAGKLEQLATLTMSPGYLTQKTFVFLATELEESSLSGDELEQVTIVKHPLVRFEELIDAEELKESRVIAALYLARRKLQHSGRKIPTAASRPNRLS